MSGAYERSRMSIAPQASRMLWRTLGLALVVMTSGCVAPTTLSTSAAPSIVSPSLGDEGTLRVYFVDVGQGDGALLVSPSGKSVLIDAGTKRGGKRIVKLMQRLGITQLDMVIMSHPHADHMGGMITVLERVPARVFLDPGYDHGSATYLRLLNYLETSNTQVRLARAGRRVDLQDGVTMTLLAPEEPLLTGTRSDANANSVVTMIRHGQIRLLFTGDAEHPTEERLLKSSTSLRAQVLKVAHHGSAYASQAHFLAQVAPQIAIISAGANNRYNHPRSETLERLRATGARILRTDKHGTITIISDGETIRVHVQRQDEDASNATAPPAWAKAS